MEECNIQIATALLGNQRDALEYSCSWFGMQNSRHLLFHNSHTKIILALCAGTCLKSQHLGS